MLIGLEPLPALTVLSLSISITLHHSMNQNFNLEMSSIIFSGGVDWPPNVMASEGLDGATPASHPPTPPTAGTPTSAGAGLLMLTHNTALSITLVIGVFFLALNLLIFGAIYRQRVQHRASRRRAHHHQLQQQVRVIKAQKNGKEMEGKGELNECGIKVDSTHQNLGQ